MDQIDKKLRIKEIDIEPVVIERRACEDQREHFPAQKAEKECVEADLAPRSSKRRWMSYALPAAITLSVLLVGLYFTGNKRGSDISEILPGLQSSENGKRVPSPNNALKPTLWVLSIGVSRYRESSLNLKFADHDAEQISALLKKQEGRLFKEVKSTILVNKDADRNSILNAVKKISENGQSYDVVFIFVAGHGMIDAGLNSYYFLPHPADPDSLLTEGLKWSDFSDTIKLLSRRVKRLVLALDTCHAGASDSVRADLASKLEIDSGYILSAGKQDEESVEGDNFRFPDEKRGHGAFTFAILKGLQGAADINKDGTIKIEELFEYLSEEIPRLTDGAQHPHRISVGSETISIVSLN